MSRKIVSPRKMLLAMMVIAMACLFAPSRSEAGLFCKKKACYTPCYTPCYTTCYTPSYAPCYYYRPCYTTYSCYTPCYR
jgi:hypothetical protein